MGRLILLLVVLFALPMALWFGARWLRHRRDAMPDMATVERWQDAPWSWLILIGLGLAVAAVLAFGILEQRDCIPVPTQVIDGKFVPAHCQ